MDVTKDSFSRALSVFQEAIASCDFVSIDMEMTGLYEDKESQPNRQDTRDDRYLKYKKSVESYGVIQVGICLFTWISGSDSEAEAEHAESGFYEARPFNFNVFPCTNVNGVPMETNFRCMNSAFEFLAKNSFDFNKWVYQGIPYLHPQEAARIRKERIDVIRNKRTKVEIGERHKQFVSEFEAALTEFVSSERPNMKCFTSNSYERRLVYQIVNEYDTLGASGRTGYIEVFKSSKKALAKQQDKRIEVLNRCIKEATGFCRVINLLSASKKPVVGHNMPLDVLHAFSKFYKPLPDTRAEFESAIGKFLPVLIDTKYIIESTPSIKSKYGTSNLDEIGPMLESEAMSSYPLIRNHARFTRHMGKNMHEAGYDAYMTGATFIRLLRLDGGLHLSDSGSGPRKDDEPSSELVLYHFINRLYLAGSNDIYWPVSGDSRDPSTPLPASSSPSPSPSASSIEATIDNPSPVNGAAMDEDVNGG